MKFVRVLSIFAAILLLVNLGFSQEVFGRKAIIPSPSNEPAGLGEVIAGVDFDNDGKQEMYAVNSNWYDVGDYTPRIYKYEWNGTAWDTVWTAQLAIPLQNTWCALTSGDWDNDGKMEVIWGPVNYLATGTNENPARVVVFESKGDGSDVMGVSLGNGNYKPNAQWTITSTLNYNLRPFKWVLSDIDHDTKKELVFCDRASSATTGYYKFGVISVSDIPDSGNGTETWTLEYSGFGQTVPTGTAYDVAVVDSAAYVFLTTGSVQPILFRNGAYSLGKLQPATTVPNGSWKTAQVVDLNKDGKKEIVIAQGMNSAGDVDNIRLVQVVNDTTLSSTIIATASIGTAGRIYGGASGDLDGDGNVDFVFGTRDASPDAAILVMKYKGGDMTLSSNYALSVVDYGQTAGRWDVLGIGNVDGDAAAEIVYGCGYGADTGKGLIVLDRFAMSKAPETIAAVRLDANKDYQVDRLNDTVVVAGIVNSVNPTASSNRFQYFIQDPTGGICVTKGSETGGGTVYAIGDRIAVKGVVGMNRGTTQLNIASITTDVIKLGSNFTVTPVTLTLDQYLADPEKYESQAIRINGVTKTAASPAWTTTASTDANMLVTDGFWTITMRLDRDTDIDGTTEPVWPIGVKGVATQFTSGTTVYNDGYQITPNAYADITPNIATAPNLHFNMLSPKNTTVKVDSSSQTLTFTWAKAIDLNGDTATYQFAPVGFAAVTAGNGGRDTFVVRTAAQLNVMLGTKDTLVLKWTAKTKDATSSLASSFDTASVTLIKGLYTATSVDGADGLPTDYSLSPNFPNPFNPTTTIRYTLAAESHVTLRVYDVLGREVATLASGIQSAGVFEQNWNARGMSSGMYIYRLEARAIDGSRIFVDTRRMALLK